MSEKTTTRVTSFEVKKVDGDWKEVTGRWRALGREVQALHNDYWQQWLVWHVSRDSAGQLRAWLNARKEQGVKAAGKCPVVAVPKELANAIYHRTRERFPSLSSRLVVLVLNRIQQGIQSRKAARGSLPGWSAILLCNEAHPGFTREMPLLFDKANATWIPPEQPGGNYRVRINVERTDIVDGKGRGVYDTLELYCQGRNVASQVAILKRIVAGEYTFRGSQLVWSEAKRRWFLRICYAMPVPAKPDLSAKLWATLRAGAEESGWPWELTVYCEGCAESLAIRHPGGRLRFVGSVRRQLLMQRWDRRANYRQAGQANKGHGRERAGAGPQWKLQQRWKDFTKRLNHGITRELVDYLVAQGVGRLVYFQPEGEYAGTRLLALAGKVEGRPESTGWPWYQVTTFLQQKCELAGIACEVKKDAGSEEEEPAAAGVSAL